jgi:hypothetical protein
MQDGASANERAIHCFTCYEGLDPLFTGERLVHKNVVSFFTQPKYPGEDPRWARGEL